MGQPSDQFASAAHPDDQFRLLVASVRDYAIFLLDLNGNVLTWNRGAERSKGYAADEIVGTHFSRFYLPEDVRSGKPAHALRVAAEQGRWEEDGWRLRKDGSRFWANVVITALRDASSTLLGYAKVTRDLTERKQADEHRLALLARESAARAEAEAALTQLRAIQSVTEVALSYLSLDDLLHALLERISVLLAVDTVAVLLVAEDDPGTLVARAAKGLEEAVEQGVRIPLGQGFAGRIVSERQPIVIDDLAHATVLNPILRTKGVQSLLGVPLLLHGRVLGVLHVGMLQPRQFTAQEVALLQVVADRIGQTLEQARLIAAVRAAQAEAAVAEARLRAQDEFLAVAAHELKTPITIQKAAAELLLRRYARQGTPDPQQVQRSVQTMAQQSEKLTRLVTMFMDTVRLHADRLHVERTATNITQLVAQAVAVAQTRTEQHDLLVAAHADVWAAVDGLRLAQVVDNLLENAIKFSPDGGRIEVTVQPAADATVQVAVRDHGLGVAEAHRAHLFERFYQAHASSHRSGLGLGLYISRAIVEQHGGTIRAEFPSDGGTRMVVTLPRAVGGAQEAGAAERD